MKQHKYCALNDESPATIGKSIEGEFCLGKNLMCKIEEGDSEQEEEERKGNLSQFKDLKVEFQGESRSQVTYYDKGARIEGNSIGGGIEPSYFNDGGDLQDDG